MTNKKIFLHLGMTKTGSTSLQMFFHNNRDVISKKGIFYPETIKKKVNHHNLIFQKENRDFLISQIENTNYDSYVISSENLYKYFIPTVPDFNEIISKYDVYPIIYLRRQETWIQSIYQQLVCQWEFKFKGNIDEFIESMSEHLRYIDIISYYDKLYGAKLSVRSYEYVSKKTDIFSDFCSVINLDTAGVDLASRKANQSMSYTGTEIIRTLNILGVPMDQRNYRKLISFFRRKSNKEAKFGFLSKNHAKQLSDKYYKMNSKIASEYMDGLHGEAFLNNEYIGNIDERQIDIDEVALIVSRLWEKAMAGQSQKARKLGRPQR